MNKYRFLPLCAGMLLLLTILLAGCSPSPAYLTVEQAKEIALEHAGVAAEDARWDEREYDIDNGQHLYELEFKAGGMEYSYDIDALSGEIKKAEKERID